MVPFANSRLWAKTSATCYDETGSGRRGQVEPEREGVGTKFEAPQGDS